jgi:hypothetical protein
VGDAIAENNTETMAERIHRIGRSHSKDLTTDDLIWALENRGALFGHVRATIAKRLAHLAEPAGDVPDEVERTLITDEFIDAVLSDMGWLPRSDWPARDLITAFHDNAALLRRYARLEAEIAVVTDSHNWVYREYKRLEAENAALRAELASSAARNGVREAKPSLDELLAQAKEWWETRTPEQQEEHLRLQRESWVRGEMALSAMDRETTQLIYSPATPADPYAGLRAQIEALPVWHHASTGCDHIDRDDVLALLPARTEGGDHG